MTVNKIKLAIFDFDGTLSKGHLWIGIAKHHRLYKVNRRKLFLYLLTHLPFWAFAKVKLYSEEKNRARWGRDLPMIFKGFSPESAAKIFGWVNDNYFMPLMRSDVIRVLGEKRKQGYKIMILSGIFTDFLKIAGNKVGVDYVVGTKLEICNNRYSGRIINPLCFGKEKANYLSDFIKQSQLDVDLSSSEAYADSIYDVSVFNMVGKPVATYPDKKLLKLARSLNWQIIDKSA